MPKLKRAAQSIVFMAISVCMALGLISIYGFSDNMHSKSVFDSLYGFPEDSLDVVWIGPSSVQMFFIPHEAYESQGIASHALATGNQPFIASKYLIEECERIQDPSVYLIDIRQLAYPDHIFDDSIRRLTSNMQQSQVRYDAIERLLEGLSAAMPDKEIDKPSYYFDFLVFHSRRDITSCDFGLDPESYMGFAIVPGIQEFDKVQVLQRLDAEPLTLDDGNMRDLLEVLDYCDSLDKKVIFTCTPNALEEGYFGKYNEAKNIIQSRGYEVWDLNDYVDDIGLDYKTDFCDPMHTNVYGAIKFTDWTADALQCRFQLPDHRGDSRYSFYDSLNNDFQSKLTELAENPA